ncbi:hypothetical protein ACFE04_020601 [Oxalis oulophora]
MLKKPKKNIVFGRDGFNISYKRICAFLLICMLATSGAAPLQDVVVPAGNSTDDDVQLPSVPCLIGCAQAILTCLTKCVFSSPNGNETVLHQEENIDIGCFAECGTAIFSCFTGCGDGPGPKPPAYLDLTRELSRLMLFV